jgi:hypothetical protein
MGAMTTFAIGPTPTDVVTMGQPIGDVRSIGAINTMLVPFSSKMSNSYSTGGDTLTIPTSPPLISGFKIQGVILTPQKYGANWYSFSGNLDTPKIQAWSAINTEVTSTTDLSAVTVSGYLVMVS